MMALKSSKKTPVIVVRVENIHGPGTARFWEISCKTVPEIPQLNEANPAQVIPFKTWLLFIFSLRIQQYKDFIIFNFYHANFLHQKRLR